MMEGCVCNLVLHRKTFAREIRKFDNYKLKPYGVEATKQRLWQKKKQKQEN